MSVYLFPNTASLFLTVKYYPTWLPFSTWKRKALEAGELVKVMFDVPYNQVKAQMVLCFVPVINPLLIYISYTPANVKAAGTAMPSYVSTLLEEFYRNGTPLTQIDEEDIKYSAGVLYGGKLLPIRHTRAMILPTNFAFSGVRNCTLL